QIQFNIGAGGVELDNDALTQERKVSVLDSEILHLVRLHQLGSLAVSGDISFQHVFIANIGRAVEAPVQSDAAVFDGELDIDGVVGIGGGRGLKREVDEASITSLLFEVFKNNWDLVQGAFGECRVRLAFV